MNLIQEIWKPTLECIELQPGEVQLWIGSIHSHQDLSSIYPILSEDEQQRAHRFLSETSRRTFIESRVILRTLLGQLIHQSPAQIQLVYTPLGKPYLSLPANQAGIHFNLSHANEYGLFGFFRDAPIGVDIEFDDRRIAYQEMMPFVFTSRECEYISSLPSECILPEFFTIWTAKEALAKATGLGCSLPFTQLDVLTENGTLKDQIHLEVESDLNQLYQLVMVPVPQQYHAAVAVAVTESTQPARLTCYNYENKL